MELNAHRLIMSRAQSWRHMTRFDLKKIRRCARTYDPPVRSSRCACVRALIILVFLTLKPPPGGGRNEKMEVEKRAIQLFQSTCFACRIMSAPCECVVPRASQSVVRRATSPTTINQSSVCIPCTPNTFGFEKRKNEVTWRVLIQFSFSRRILKALDDGFLGGAMHFCSM